MRISDWSSDVCSSDLPVLAVKLQELFGLADTPRIADGRVPLTVHLLSPAGRPLQVTRDLRSFWQNTYPEVRREMKGRYPKHPWPDRSEEHTSELQSLMRISYAVFCLKKKKK